MHESDTYSDTYLAILEEGQEKGTKNAILVVGEELLGLRRKLLSPNSI